MQLNPQSPIPLYLQIASRIRAEVNNQAFPAGGKIPSENELALGYGVGRPTVRQATDLLVREGLLERRRGSGTYVLPPARRIDLFSLAGTSAALRSSKLPSRTEVLFGPALNPDVGQLSPGFQSDSAFELQRRSLIAEEPVLLERIYLNPEVFAGVERKQIEGDSLARIVRDEFHLEATSAEQTFAIFTAGKEISRLLDLKQRTPLLHVSRLIHFGPFQGAIYCDIYCRTDKFNFTQTITTSDLQRKETLHAK